MTSTPARVKAMEIACVFSPEDYKAYLESVGHVEDGEVAEGFKYSGSFCGRNIEKIYEKAVVYGSRPSLERAVEVLREARHVLVITGFFVLHQKQPEGPCGALGGCETDGPLGALAVLRALVARGLRVSLFCDEHNGPVIKKAYDTMMEYFQQKDPGFWQQLQRQSRCLSFVKASATCSEELRLQVFGKKTISKLEERCLSTCHELGQGLRGAWGDARVDALFSLERLGAPYRNIRGRDIGEHTEPIDCLFPVVQGVNEECHALLAEMPLAALRRVAQVAETARCVAVGDGGNEVGMGKVVCAPGVSVLSPGGDKAALSVNGCVRSCDAAVLGTVSNWAGSAIEAACHVLWPAEVDYVIKMSGEFSNLEKHLLEAIMAKPTLAVDGSHNDREMSVDGLAFEPFHREFYDFLWRLALDALDGKRRKL